MVVCSSGAEECDDGNTISNDGCSSTCRLEVGFRCYSNCAGRDICHAICGDGRRVGEEECDDGNSIEQDGCTSCMVDDGYICMYGNPLSADLCRLDVQVYVCVGCRFEYMMCAGLCLYYVQI